jgi:hypothetical protein
MAPTPCSLLVEMKVFYTLDSLLNSKQRFATFPFVVCQEIEPQEYTDIDGNILLRTRRWLAFTDPNAFYAAGIDHCHEAIVAQTYGNSMIKCIGKILFDFDVPKSIKMPKYFRYDFFALCLLILRTRYIGVNVDGLEPVWLECDNPKKTSLHLVIKGACFVDWAPMLSHFYKLVGEEMGKNPVWSWIAPDKLVDRQVARQNATMRLPMQSKRGGNPMRMDEPDRNVHDALVMLYRHEDKANHQHIVDRDAHGWTEDQVSISKHFPDSVDSIADRVLREAYEAYSISDDKSGQFEVLGFFGRFVDLKRKKPGMCIVSGIIHDGDNAYLFVTPEYDVYFFCRRKCIFSGKMHKRVGPPRSNKLKLS